MAYKPYPCCRFFHGQLDAFIKILETNNLLPENIESVRTYAFPFVANASPYDVQTQIDAQFSLPFVFAAAAYRVKIGAAWQEWETIRDPKIREFMKKVIMIADPKAMEAKHKDPRSWPAKVEVKVHGKTFIEETVYARGTNFTDFKASDKELVEKFRCNAARLLTESKIERVIESIFEVDKAKDVNELTSLLAL
jgi:2-methylcitrate dehydratase PrpD